MNVTTRACGRFVALVAVALALLGAVGGPAIAQSTTDPQQQEVHSWALAPTGSDPTQPGSRPNYSYALEPGAVINDSATLWNYSNVQLTFHVYATDAFNTNAGDFTLLPGDKSPKDVGTWVHVAQDYITVPPATSVELPITITVPSDAKPGDHVGGIVASSQTPATAPDGKQVLLDRRTGSRIYLRVNGPVNPSLTVEELSSTYHGSINPLDGSLDVTYTVRNTGNIRLAAHQKVSVNDVFGSVAEHTPKDIPELLPGNAVVVHDHFDGVAATVRLSTDVTLTPEAGTGNTAPAPSAKLRAARTVSTAHTWAIPWTLLALLALLGIIVLVVRRFRRPSDDGPGPLGATGGQGGVAPNGSAPAPRAPAGVPRQGLPPRWAPSS